MLKKRKVAFIIVGAVLILSGIVMLSKNSGYTSIVALVGGIIFLVIGVLNCISVNSYNKTLLEKEGSVMTGYCPYCGNLINVERNKFSVLDNHPEGAAICPVCQNNISLSIFVSQKSGKTPQRTILQSQSDSRFQSNPQPYTGSQYQSDSQPYPGSQYQSNPQPYLGSQYQSNSQPYPGSQYQSNSQPYSAPQFQSNSQFQFNGRSQSGTQSQYNSNDSNPFQQAVNEDD